MDDGGLILGICNGFQVMAKAGILPDISNPQAPPLTLATNDSGKFECRWVHLLVEKRKPLCFYPGYGQHVSSGSPWRRQGSHRYARLREINAVLYYTDESGNTQAGYPYNPNGSMNNIAGVCDSYRTYLRSDASS